MSSSRLAAASRIVAAVLGSLFVALGTALVIALLLKDSPSLAVAVALLITVPTWATAMCLGFLARSERRAWALYAGAGAALAVAVFVLSAR